MTKIYFIVCLFGVSLASAENITVFFNGKDCGVLNNLSIEASAISIDTTDTTDCLEKELPKPPPDGLVDPACSTEPSLCKHFELAIDKSTNYSGKIMAGHRHVYHFKAPTEGSISLPAKNRLIRFTVVDHGAEVSVNLGFSHVKGRIQPIGGDTQACFTGPGTELSLIAATDATYTDCKMVFDTDYYFTIENLDEFVTGGYLLEFNKGGEY